MVQPCTSADNSIFAQNNGVIALTRCANRRAGYICASFMILYGGECFPDRVYSQLTLVLGKISGVFLSIPNPVLGGVTTFLFASVVASGIKVISYIKFTRKDRFILAAAGAFGFGNLLVPDWASYLFADVNSPSSSLQGFFNSIVIVISTPYLIAGLVASILYQIIPDEVAEAAPPSPSFVESGLEAGVSELPREGPSESSEKEQDYKARGVAQPGSSGAKVEVLDA